MCICACARAEYQFLTFLNYILTFLNSSEAQFKQTSFVWGIWLNLTWTLGLAAVVSDACWRGPVAGGGFCSRKMWWRMETWLTGSHNTALAPQPLVAATPLCFVLTLQFTLAPVHSDFCLSWMWFPSSSEILWLLQVPACKPSCVLFFASCFVKPFRLFYCFVFHDWYFFVRFRLELPLLSLPGVTKLLLPFPAILLQAVPLTHRYNLHYSSLSLCSTPICPLV